MLLYPWEGQKEILMCEAEIARTSFAQLFLPQLFYTLEKYVN